MEALGRLSGPSSLLKTLFLLLCLKVNVVGYTVWESLKWDVILFLLLPIRTLPVPEEFLLDSSILLS